MIGDWLPIAGLVLILLVASLHEASKELNNAPKPPKQHAKYAWLFCIYCALVFPGLYLANHTEYILLQGLGGIASAAGLLTALGVPWFLCISLLGYGTTGNKQYLKILLPVSLYLTLLTVGLLLFRYMNTQ